MATVREAFLSRLRSLMEVLRHYSNFDDGNIDNILTRGNLLYYHAVRLASVNIVEDAAIAMLRAVVDLLSEVEESKQNFSFQPEVEYTGAPGMPKICVTNSCYIYFVLNPAQSPGKKIIGNVTAKNYLKETMLSILCFIIQGKSSSGKSLILEIRFTAYGNLTRLGLLFSRTQ